MKKSIEKYRTLMPVNEGKLLKYYAPVQEITYFDQNYKEILFGKKGIKFWQEKITRIIMSNMSSVESVIKAAGTNICKDISVEKNASVFGWIECPDDKEAILHIDSTGKISAPANSQCLFANFKKLRKIDWNNLLKTDQTVNMYGMFSGCLELEVLDVSHFCTQNVTDMSYMFSFCKNLEMLNVSRFDTKQVTDFSYMFYECERMEKLDISNFSIKNAIDLSYMFYGCKNIKSLDMEVFLSGNVMDSQEMFTGCNKIFSSAPQWNKQSWLQTLKSRIKK